MVIFNCYFNNGHLCFASFYNAIKDFDNKRATSLSARYFILLEKCCKNIHNVYQDCTAAFRTIKR